MSETVYDMSVTFWLILFLMISEFITWRQKEVTFRKVMILLIIGDDEKRPCFFCHGAIAASRPRFPSCWGFMITLRHITLGRTPLKEWSARRRDLYLTTHNTHKRQTSMPPGGIRNHNPSKRVTADPRLIQCDRWNRLKTLLILATLLIWPAGWCNRVLEIYQ